MKITIEIESREDYEQGAALQRLLTTLMIDGLLPAIGRAWGAELAHALDDYRQIHYPLGGEPKP
jgi:hypothetical protein